MGTSQYTERHGSLGEQATLPEPPGTGILPALGRSTSLFQLSFGALEVQHQDL